jgi:hypothetical protein
MKKIIMVALICIVFSTVSAMAAECDCVVDQVANMGNRVHVHCQTYDAGTGTGFIPSPYPFFALPLDSPLVDTFTTMAQTVAIQNLRDERSYEIKGFGATLSTGGYVGYVGGTNGQIESYGLPFMLHIWYDETDTTGTSFGCLDTDCRIPQAFGIIDPS